MLYRRGDRSFYVKKFVSEKIKKILPWAKLKSEFDSAKLALNLPENYSHRMMKIFEAELNGFKKLLK